uniref:Ubiquitin-like domain-containing protein n=1 Tax=Lotharella globosa TaxID=91324 RepID=A0A7S3YUH8_9EUKA|mmetsp:Transcript_17322/g.34936  ORF Transcript_17322/g.34936 Transcript_17322/m.34936 type:complete len:118 (+) Transcript_17322:186-539(+)
MERGGLSSGSPEAHALPWLKLIIGGESKQRVRVVTKNLAPKRELWMDLGGDSKIKDLLALVSRTLGVCSQGHELEFMGRRLEIETTLSWNHIFPGATLSLVKSSSSPPIPNRDVEGE